MVRILLWRLGFGALLSPGPVLLGFCELLEAAVGQFILSPLGAFFLKQRKSYWYANQSIFSEI